ncbi:MAG: sulfatase-like hydrolase/transferase [Phycisphaerae bacterium]|nr:sulfatase-like hydrolase/transferase [Phycisphaerae bacterium]
MPSKPNILLIMADQLRADALGCYGNDVSRTPNLDALAAGGVCFENSFTPNPICVPARASITTGNYSHRATGVKENAGLIRDDQPRIGAHFASCGYETYACGKLHYVPYAPPAAPRLLHGFAHCDLTESGRILKKFDPKGELRGLEDYHDYLADVGWAGFSRAHGIGNNDVRPCPSPVPSEHHVDHWVADRTIERMQSHVRNVSEKPFFIWCSFPKPHAPYDPPAEYVNMYDVRDIPPPVGDESMLADRNPFLQWTRITHALDSLSPQARRVIKGYYYGLIAHQDAQIGRVLDALNQTQQGDNTIVVYVADHGDLMGDFGMYFKCSFLEGSVRVPIIVKGPGIPAAGRRKQLVGLQDVLPTLAELTDCPLVDEVDGVSLVPASRHDSAEVRDIFYSQCLDTPNQSAMVCDGRFKYIYSQAGPTEQLYDLQADPHELVNLASRSDHEQLLEPWRRRLIDEARRVGDTAILDGEDLVSSKLDRASYAALGVTEMGWRWY